MLSRVADAIYWMNRYMERAENVARVVDVNLHLSLDFPEGDEQWAPLVHVVDGHSLAEIRSLHFALFLSHRRPPAVRPSA
jgi:uncharacterized alpha-E superfamily protein